MAAAEDVGAAQAMPEQNPTHTPLVGSPKRHSDASSPILADERSGGIEIRDSHQSEEDSPPEAFEITEVQTRRQGGRSGDGSWLDDLMEESGKLRHAPPDLFIVYSIKVAECTAYYGISYVYTHYLTEEFGLTDQEAGNLYAVYGLLCTGIGILMGVSIDRLGVRKAMMIGAIANTVGRALTFYTTSKFVVIMASVTFLPLGAAFAVPSLALGVRRYTHEDNRSFAFSFFYVALCVACVFSSILINRIRWTYLEGVDAFGFHWTWMRIVIVWCTVLTAYCIGAAYCIRDIQVRSDMPLEDEAFVQYKRQGRTNIREIMAQRRFWRVVGVTFIFCGVRMAFRHLDATFPKYFIRTHGRDAPFELIVGLEPVVTMLVTPFVTLLLVRFNWRLDRTLLIGAFISGLSVFILALEETYASAIAFVVVLAVGESIWSPKLYEFSTMAAPEGREGIYVAISFAPMYLASVPVGWLSGWVLAAFCPRNSLPEERHGQLMWFIIACTSFSSFALLCCCQHRLFPPDESDDAIEQPGEDEDGDSL